MPNRRMKMDNAEYCLDASGLICPEPLMLVRNKVREMKTGEVVHVLATDPSTERDLTNFCRFMGHTLLSHERVGATHHYRLRKG
jgi:tRNA 2-thiouridine synthesizing protein A